MAQDGHADMAMDGPVAGGDGVFEPEMLELLPTMAADGDELADAAASNMANIIQAQTYEKDIAEPSTPLWTLPSNASAAGSWMPAAKAIYKAKKHRAAR
jgi:hypothetical protein